MNYPASPNRTRNWVSPAKRSHISSQLGPSMKTRLRSRRSNESGQTMLEFLMMVLFIMLLFVGFIELMLLLYAYNVVADGAKEGVRYAITHGSLSASPNGPTNNPTGVINAITSYANASGQAITGDITVTYSDPLGINKGKPCNAPGCQVDVDVAHNYRPFFGLGWPTVILHAAARGTVTY
jgi:Flp pilus assembly protein TadG